MPVAERAVRTNDEFESILTDIFCKAGWRVHRHAAVGDVRADLVVDGGGKKYVVEVKGSSEGRRDRLIPLLSQAILQATLIAQQFPEHAVPVAVVGSKRIPASVVEQIKRFASIYASNVGVGIIDTEGLVAFVGPGLEGLDAKPVRRMVRQDASQQRLPDLFSGLNQWMLKILLGQSLPESLLSVPREQIRNASQLAGIANVSVMSASRLVNQLKTEGFLDEHGDHLQIVRSRELLERWVSANRQMARDIPLRWILKKDEKQFFASVAKYAAENSAAPMLKSRARTRVVKPPPRCCIGLFAAADALGVGFVRGVPPHLYLESLDFAVLQKLGLSVQDSERRVDVYVRVPSNKEAIFRAAVIRDGLPISDVLQVWLDCSTHPARGREQADEIRRRILTPLFGKQQ